MEAERLEQLKKILEKNYGKKFSDLEATEIGKSLIRYFDTLLQCKWRLEDEETKANRTP